MLFRSQRSGLLFTLPREAQWEYACRAGTTTLFAFGATLTPAPANTWGLHDMHGNVREWCLDSWHESYQGAPTDGSPWQEGCANSRLLRGGSWNADPRNCRSAYRGLNQPDNANFEFGFRVVCLPQGPSLNT